VGSFSSSQTQERLEVLISLSQVKHPFFVSDFFLSIAWYSLLDIEFRIRRIS